MPSERELVALLEALLGAYERQREVYVDLGRVLRRFVAAAEAPAAPPPAGDGTDAPPAQPPVAETGGRALAALVDEQARLLGLLQERERGVNAALAEVAAALALEGGQLTLGRMAEIAGARGWSDATRLVHRVAEAVEGATRELRLVQAALGEADQLLQGWVAALRGAVSQTEAARRAAAAYASPTAVRRRSPRFVDHRR
ncbi:MAG TPA: hypothetical protein VF234_06515 [Limnochordia bacterium]